MLSHNPFNNTKSRVLIDLLHCIRVHDILFIYVITLIKKRNIDRGHSCSNLLKFRFTTAARYMLLHMALMYSLIHIMGLFIFQLTYLLSRRKYITKFLFYFFLVKQQNRLFANLKLTLDMHILILYIKKFNILYPTHFVTRFVYFILCNASYHDVNIDFFFVIANTIKGQIYGVKTK